MRMIHEKYLGYTFNSHWVDEYSFAIIFKN